MSRREKGPEAGEEDETLDTKDTELKEGGKGQWTKGINAI